MNGFLSALVVAAATMRATPRALARSAYKGCMHPLFHGVLYVVFTVILRNFVSYLRDQREVQLVRQVMNEIVDAPFSETWQKTAGRRERPRSCLGIIGIQSIHLSLTE